MLSYCYAWTPLVIMWAGIGENAVIVLIFLSAVWPIVYGAFNVPDNFEPDFQTPSNLLLCLFSVSEIGNLKLEIIFRALPSLLPDWSPVLGGPPAA